MANIRISQQWLDNLSRYLDDVEDNAYESAEDNVAFLQQQVVDKAANTPGWEQLANEIEVWSQDGQLWVGIRNKAYVSEAWLLEYGNEENAPNVLFRALGEQVGQTNEFATTSAIARYGAGRFK
jgi:hypothetical protein